MRLLVNTSNLVIGGGIQVGVWFIRACMQRQLDVHFAISPAIDKELMQYGIDTNGATIHKFDRSPARNKQTRQAVKQLADRLNVDAVYTVFGPAYVAFNQPHLTGFADGWVSHSSWLSFKRSFAGNMIAGLRLMLTSIYKALQLRQADQWIFETDVAARGMCKRARLSPSACHVVANNCADDFYTQPVVPEPDSGEFRLLYLTADYPHKGVNNFLGYARELKRLDPDKRFVFVISLLPSSPSAKAVLSQAQQLGLSDYFDFCGPVPVANTVNLIDSVNVVMQMSYLETFSANYPEAMARERSLLVSDYSFSRDICKNAAEYVNPDDASAVAHAIINMQNSASYRRSLVEKGKHVLAQLPRLEQRFDRYMEIITAMKSRS